MNKQLLEKIILASTTMGAYSLTNLRLEPNVNPSYKGDQNSWSLLGIILPKFEFTNVDLACVEGI